MKKFFMLIILIFFINVVNAANDCTNDTNITCVQMVNEEFGDKNYILALYFGFIIAFLLFVWYHVKDYKPKGKIWESPANFFFAYTKLVVWFWFVMILLYSQRLIFASHTDDYFNQIIAWWDTWFYITLFPYTIFVLYFLYRKILSLPSFKVIIRDVKEWFK